MRRFTILTLAVALLLSSAGCCPCGVLNRREARVQPATPGATATPRATATPQPVAVTDPAAQADLHRFAGTWDTDWGPLVFTVEGDMVLGEYQYREGSQSVTGRVELAPAADGRSLEGTWAQPPSYEPPADAGRVVFALSDDGQTLLGQWWYGEDQGGGEWNGRRSTEAIAPAPGEVGLALSSDPDNDLLFVSIQADGSRLYYHGLGSGGRMRLSHVTRQDPTGELEAIIFSRDLLPIQWILAEATIAVYPREACEDEPEDGWGCFDPRKALHSAVYDRQETTLTADIYPSDLQAVIEGLEAASGTRLESARAFLARYDLSFEELVALAGEEGPEQGRYIAAATAFSTGAAALGLMEAQARSSTAPRTAGLAAPPAAPLALLFWQIPLEIAIGMAAGELLGAWLDPLGGDGPKVGVLLCQGASKIPNVCHYMFYHRSRLSECVARCLTSLGCFTNICMPKDISVGLALRTAR